MMAARKLLPGHLGGSRCHASAHQKRSFMAAAAGTKRGFYRDCTARRVDACELSRAPPRRALVVRLKVKSMCALRSISPDPRDRRLFMETLEVVHYLPFPARPVGYLSYF